MLFFTPQKITLLRQLVLTDFKLRYQGSVLGYFWSLLKPMMMFGVLYLVFTYIIPIGKDVPHFPAYLLLGIVIWTFFIESTNMGLGSIVGRGDMLRKINVSKVSIVLAAVLSAGINFLFNLTVVGVFMLLSGADINWMLVPWLLPLLIELILLAFGISLMLSALYVRYRDFAPIWEVVLQAMFYATPIIYPLTLALSASETVAKILMLSPLAQIIQDVREILITPVTITGHEIMKPTLSYGIPILIVLLLLGCGWLYFRHRSKYFAEDM